MKNSLILIAAAVLSLAACEKAEDKLFLYCDEEFTLAIMAVQPQSASIQTTTGKFHRRNHGSQSLHQAARPRKEPSRLF